MSGPTIVIAGRRIGPGSPVDIVAEMSANHGQRFEDAVRIIEAAKAAGVDAVKFVTADVRAGQPFTERNVRSIRPGIGLAPRHYHEVLGRTAARDIVRGTPLSWDLVAGA